MRGLGPEGITLVDYKAGFEDSARGALTSLDWALTVVDPTLASVHLAVDLARTVHDMRAGVPPATRHLDDAALVEVAVRLYRESAVLGVLSVLNRVDSIATEAQLRGALGQDAPRVIGAFAEDKSIQGQWLRGERLQSHSLLGRAVAAAQALEGIQREQNLMADRIDHRCGGGPQRPPKEHAVSDPIRVGIIICDHIGAAPVGSAFVRFGRAKGRSARTPGEKWSSWASRAAGGVPGATSSTHQRK